MTLRNVGQIESQLARHGLRSLPLTNQLPEAQRYFTRPLSEIDSDPIYSPTDPIYSPNIYNVVREIRVGSQCQLRLVEVFLHHDQISLNLYVE